MSVCVCLILDWGFSICFITMCEKEKHEAFFFFFKQKGNEMALCMLIQKKNHEGKLLGEKVNYRKVCIK